MPAETIARMLSEIKKLYLTIREITETVPDDASADILVVVIAQRAQYFSEISAVHGKLNRLFPDWKNRCASAQEIADLNEELSRLVTAELVRTSLLEQRLSETMTQLRDQLSQFATHAQAVRSYTHHKF